MEPAPPAPPLRTQHAVHDSNTAPICLAEMADAWRVHLQAPHLLARRDKLCSRRQCLAYVGGSLGPGGLQRLGRQPRRFAPGWLASHTGVQLAASRRRMRAPEVLLRLQLVAAFNHGGCPRCREARRASWRHGCLVVVAIVAVAAAIGSRCRGRPGQHEWLQGLQYQHDLANKAGQSPARPKVSGQQVAGSREAAGNGALSRQCNLCKHQVSRMPGSRVS